MNSRVRSRGGNGLPSTAMVSLRGDVERRRIDDAAVDGDAALRDPFLGIAARGQAGAGHHLGDALAGFLDACGGCGARLSNSGLALAIGTTAAERRTFCKNLAVVLVLAARPIVTRLRCADAPASRCGLRAVQSRCDRDADDRIRAILARTGKARTLLATTVVARPVKARLVEIARTVTGGTGITLAAILALLPRL